MADQELEGSLQEAGRTRNQCARVSHAPGRRSRRAWRTPRPRVREITFRGEEPCRADAIGVDRLASDLCVSPSGDRCYVGSGRFTQVVDRTRGPVVTAVDGPTTVDIYRCPTEQKLHTVGAKLVHHAPNFTLFEPHPAKRPENASTDVDPV